MGGGAQTGTFISFPHNPDYRLATLLSHLAGVTGAGFRNVTLVHSFSADHAPGLVLQGGRWERGVHRWGGMVHEEKV